MNYIILTPAYNEDKYIAETIESVIAQTIKPLLWIVVDDGSTDQTANIVKQYAARYTWIYYTYRQKDPTQSYYASNVYAIQHGVNLIKNSQLTTQNVEYLAILDADITLPTNYYRTISNLFMLDNKLGIVSGNCADKVGNTLKKHLYDRRSCAKAIMVFRTACFEEIGGFVPMKYGGEDTVACFEARRLGWKTWAEHELLVTHNKPLGTGPSKSMFKIRFRQGISEYFLGSHPLFVILKSFRRCIVEPPYIVGGLMRMFGFIYAHFMREQRQLPNKLVHFIRREQLSRVFRGNKMPSEYQPEAIK